VFFENSVEIQTIIIMDVSGGWFKSAVDEQQTD